MIILKSILLVFMLTLSAANSFSKGEALQEKQFVSFKEVEVYGSKLQLPRYTLQGRLCETYIKKAEEIDAGADSHGMQLKEVKMHLGVHCGEPTSDASGENTISKGATLNNEYPTFDREASLKAAFGAGLMSAYRALLGASCVSIEVYPNEGRRKLSDPQGCQDMAQAQLDTIGDIELSGFTTYRDFLKMQLEKAKANLLLSADE